jgi:hypothetical protein
MALSLVPAATAQITTTGIHGIVRDPSGALVPNVDLTLKDTATGIEKTTSSTADGAFAFVNMLAGKYDLTASIKGFDTAVYSNIVVDTGRITDVTVDLKVGAATTKVEVEAAGVGLATTTNEVGSTINANNINSLPYNGRDALNFTLYVPGAQSASGGSTFNGLPNASMNISIDGMNNNSNRFKSGGTSFYGFAPVRLDAVEEVAVSTSGLGADAAGMGAMQIRFTTKRGTDTYKFHLLYQAANEDFNANTYFNILRGIHRSKTRTANYVGSVGGPLAPWISRLKHRLFFFINFEDLPQPGATTYATTVLQPDMLNGNMTYLGTDGANHTVNVLSVAKAAGRTSTIDPTLGAMLNSIQATQKDPSVVSFLPISGVPYQQTMYWGFATDTETKYPTVRVDYQITNKLFWHGVWDQRHANTVGNPNYPGGPYPSNNAYKIDTPVTSNTLDWTITPHLLNSFMVGTQSNMEYFNNPSDPHQWAAYNNRNLRIPLINPLIPNNTPWKRNNPVWQFADNLTWVKGKHTVTAGGSFFRTSFYEQSWGDAGVMSVYFGVDSNDPMGNLIQGAMPSVNLNGSDVGNAQNLYALLTGTVTNYYTSLNVDENSHQFKSFAPAMQRFAINTGGLYAQDSWRVTPHLVLNYGLRWQFDGGVRNTNGVDTWPTNIWGPSSGPFQPGALTGDANPAVNLKGSVYGSDLVNPAPNIGFAWNPSLDGGGLLGRLVGHEKTVIAGSFNINYYNEGMNTISNLLCCNPGTTQSSSANVNSQFQAGTQLLGSPMPALDTEPKSFSFPYYWSNNPYNNNSWWNYANPNLRSPYVMAWNFRVQREIVKGTVLDVRYVGNHGVHLWHLQNMNETNIFENGFLQQFQQAQQNLAIANGMTVAQLTALPTPSLKVRNFSNTGLAGQAATPIFDTAFAGLSTSSGYGSSSFLTNLQQGAVATMAATIGDTTNPLYSCNLFGANFAPCANLGYTKKTAYPANMFYANPYTSVVQYQDDNGSTNYNALQVEMTRSFSHGLMVKGYYVWSHTLGDFWNSSDQTATFQNFTLRNRRLNYGPTPFDHRHNFTSYWTYQLPVGKGKWLNVNNRVLNGIVGNWTVSGTDQVISGAMTRFTGARATFNTFPSFTSAPSGVVFGSGLNMSQLLTRLQTMTTGQFVASCNCFKTNVADISQANGAPNPAFLAPDQTAGQLGSPIWYPGKTAINLNLALAKEFRVRERYKLGFWAEATNFLNHPFFAMGTLSTTSTSFGNITSASGNRTILVRAYLDF